MTDAVTKTVNLALQGGGSHGAFTWGVLDRLLEDERLAIEGITGTSAGAMNAAILVQGWSKDGRKGARKTLDAFWHRVADLAVLAPAWRSAYDVLVGNWNVDDSPTAYFADLFQHALSPYQINPLGVNPLLDIVKDMVVEKDIQRGEPLKLFITATNVETGKPHVFERDKITVPAIMASACLPFLYQAVEVDGVPHWDGGYMGNPVIWPLIYGCQSPDVVLVQITPLTRPGTPRTTTEIINRVNEISFNSSLMAEMRAIAFVQRLIGEERLKSDEDQRLKHMHIHRIAAEDEMRALGAASKANAALDFLLHLRELGRKTADAWLAATWEDLGQRTSIDLRGIFL